MEPFFTSEDMCTHSSETLCTNPINKPIAVSIRQKKADLELSQLLNEADEDVRAGRIDPIGNTFSAIRQQLLSTKDR